MKKIVAVFLIIVSLFATIAVAESNVPSYLNYSLSTMTFIGEIKDRMAALDAKENPSNIDVELCLQYAEMYARLLNLSAIEMSAVTSDTVPELGGYEELLNTLGAIRSVYDAGAVSADEVIAGVVKGVISE